MFDDVRSAKLRAASLSSSVAYLIYLPRQNENSVQGNSPKPIIVTIPLVHAGEFASLAQIEGNLPLSPLRSRSCMPLGFN